MTGAFILWIGLLGVPLVIVGLTLFRHRGISWKRAWLAAFLALSGWAIASVVLFMVLLFLGMAHGYNDQGEYRPIGANLPEVVFIVLFLAYAFFGVGCVWGLWQYQSRIKDSARPIP